MMKCISVIALLLCFQVYGAAQQIQSRQHTTNLWTLRFNPLGLTDPVETNFSAGGEYTLTSRVSVAADIGYIFYSGNTSTKRTTSGLFFKPAIRYYTADKHFFFIEAVPFYKQVGKRMEGWLGKDCINDVPVYEKYQRFTLQKHVLGLNFQAGIKMPLSKNKVFGIELYQGLGIRIKWQGIKNDPRACVIDEWIFNSGQFHNRQVLPAMPFGVRLLYSFAGRDNK